MRVKKKSNGLYQKITLGGGSTTTIQNLNADIWLAVLDSDVAPTEQTGLLLETYDVLKVESTKFVYVLSVSGGIDIELEVI